MPIKLPEKIMSGTAEQRIDKFRKTIAPGMAYSIEEVAAHPDVQCHYTAARICLRKNKWGVKIACRQGQPTWHLVNPKDLTKYAD